MVMVLPALPYSSHMDSIHQELAFWAFEGQKTGAGKGKKRPNTGAGN